MKRIVVSLMMVLAAAVCWGQNTLIVVPLQNQGNVVSANDVATLVTLLESAIRRTGRFDIPDRGALNDLMAEARFQANSDWSDSRITSELGKVLNADYLVRGTVSRLGSNLVITARVLDIKTTKILDSTEMRTTMDEAYDKMDNFARELTDEVKTEIVQQQEATEQSRRASEAEQARRQAEQSRSAAQARAKLDADWTNKRWYIGFSVGGGNFGTYVTKKTQRGGDYSWEEESFEMVGGVVLFKAELDIAKYFALDFDIGLAIGELSLGTIEPCGKLLAHIPIRLDSGVDIGVLGGIYGGEPEWFGLAEGFSVGYRIGKGEIFAELVFLQNIIESDNDPQKGIIGGLGYKVGFGNRK
jgi:TolB-like protein